MQLNYLKMLGIYHYQQVNNKLTAKKKLDAIIETIDEHEEEKEENNHFDET